MIHLLTVEEKEAIKRYNAASKLNNFLYKEEASKDLFMDTFLHKCGTGADRFQLVDMCNKISRELTPGIHRFHGKTCMIDGIAGVIKHELKREYIGRILDNETCFRASSYEDVNCEETIALWVETGDKFTSHLYTIDKIKITG